MLPTRFTSLSEIQNTYGAEWNVDLRQSGTDGVSNATANSTVDYVEKWSSDPGAAKDLPKMRAWRNTLSEVLKERKKVACFPFGRDRQSNKILRAVTVACERVERAEQESLRKRLEIWVNAENGGEVEDKRVAAEDILALRTTGSTVLKLTGKIGTVPPLPNNLTSFELRDTNVMSLHGMPEEMNSLEVLSIVGNPIISLEGMPKRLSNLTGLYLSENRLASLKYMPQGMKKLEYLYIEGNALTSLLDMPTDMEKLRNLALCKNRLRSVESLPAIPSLKWLDLSENPLRSFRGISTEFSRLRTIKAKNTEITSLDGIPREFLLSSRFCMYLQGNQLSDDTIRQIHALSPTEADIEHDMAVRPAAAPRVQESLSNEVGRWFRGKAAVWAGFTDERGASSMANLLFRLGGTAVFHPPFKDASVDALGAILDLAERDHKFRAYCFDLCAGAEADCHDNVQVTFDNLRLASLDPSLRNNATIDDVLAYHRKASVYMLIDNFVSEKWPGPGDQLERGLALRKSLCETFDLPVNPRAMWHEGVAGLTPEDIKAAKVFINEKLSTSAPLIEQLKRSPLWETFVQSRYPKLFDAHNEALQRGMNDAFKGDGYDVRTRYESSVKLLVEKLSVLIVSRGKGAEITPQDQIDLLAGHPEWQAYLKELNPKIEAEQWEPAKYEEMTRLTLAKS